MLERWFKNPGETAQEHEGRDDSGSFRDWMPFADSEDREKLRNGFKK